MFFPVTVVRKQFPVSLQRPKTFPILTSALDLQNPAEFPFTSIVSVLRGI